MRWPLTLMLLLLAWSARANQLTVDLRTPRMNDLVTVTVRLERSFAANDYVEVPLTNLAFVGEPSVSTEFAFINGEVMRRKTFRYRARPLAPGRAAVGPIELESEDGQVDRLEAVHLVVQEDRAAGSNDPEIVLRELMALGRDPFFVVALADKQTVFAGEPVVITWFMYNGGAMQQWQVVNVPRLSDFWTEELTREEGMERVYVGDVMMQRVPVRRVALFPLRSGRLRVPGMTVEAALIRGRRRGPYDQFEGMFVEAAFTSNTIDIDVRPLPDGPPVDAVGDFALQCDAPVQRGSGPVVLRVTLSGRGNARAASPPRFERGVDGTLHIEGGAVTIDRDSAAAEMTRRWDYLIFPARGGPMEIPALTLRTFAPRAGLRQELRCASTFLDVVAARAPEARREPPRQPPVRRAPGWPWLAGGAALLLTLGAALPRLHRELALRREARAIVRGATPAEIRARMEARVSIDVREASDRGDAWRALRSLVDAAERERDIAAEADQELLRRVRDVLALSAPGTGGRRGARG